MSYLVSAPVKTKWKIEPAVFIARLTERWPGVKVRERAVDFPFSYDWEIEMPGGVFDGRLSEDPWGVSLDGDLEDCVAFALWFRSLAPPEQPLLFYDDCFSVDVPLTYQTTAADIVAAFS